MLTASTLSSHQPAIPEWELSRLSTLFLDVIYVFPIGLALSGRLDEGVGSKSKCPVFVAGEMSGLG